MRRSERLRTANRFIFNRAYPLLRADRRKTDRLWKHQENGSMPAPGWDASRRSP
jgi:hypothetical protein